MANALRPHGPDRSDLLAVARSAWRVLMRMTPDRFDRQPWRARAAPSSAQLRLDNRDDVPPASGCRRGRSRLAGCPRPADGVREFGDAVWPLLRDVRGAIWDRAGEA
jgi:hypothetical protein